LPSVAPLKWLYSLLPTNHYGIGGCINLLDAPVVPVTAEQAALFLADIRHIRDRMADTQHRFYKDLMGSLALTMVYDLFNVHAQRNESTVSTDRTAYVVSGLIEMLETGISRTEREWGVKKKNSQKSFLSDFGEICYR